MKCRTLRPLSGLTYKDEGSQRLGLSKYLIFLPVLLLRLGRVEQVRVRYIGVSVAGLCVYRGTSVLGPHTATYQPALCTETIRSVQSAQVLMDKE